MVDNMSQMSIRNEEYSTVIDTTMQVEIDKTPALLHRCNDSDSDSDEEDGIDKMPTLVAKCDSDSDSDDKDVRPARTIRPTKTKPSAIVIATIPMESYISRVARGSKRKRKPKIRTKKPRSPAVITRANLAKRSIMTKIREPMNEYLDVLKNKGWLNEDI